MTFADIPAGTAVFLDANTLVYYFIGDPSHGAACQDLLERIERGEIQGFVSAHVIGETVHKLMTHEARIRFGWAPQGIAGRLKRHPAEVQRLTRYRQALDEVPLLGLQVLPVTSSQVSSAADECRRFGLLTNDALIVVIMRDHGLSHLASHDADFDRIPGLTRYAPA